MRGGRLAPHAARNPALRARQARQSYFLRSSANLTTSVRQNMRELTGREVRELMPRTQPSMPLEPTSRQQAAKAVFSMVKSIVEKGAPRLNDALKNHLSPTSATGEHYGRIAQGLGMLRDADGNVVYVDDHDRPYVLVENGRIVYVKVFKARVTPAGVNLDAKCTVGNVDGKQEVLLVEPIPSIGMSDQSPI